MNSISRLCSTQSCSHLASLVLVSWHLPINLEPDFFFHVFPPVFPLFIPCFISIKFLRSLSVSFTIESLPPNGRNCWPNLTYVKYAQEAENVLTSYLMKLCVRTKDEFMSAFHAIRQAVWLSIALSLWSQNRINSVEKSYWLDTWATNRVLFIAVIELSSSAALSNGKDSRFLTFITFRFAPNDFDWDWLYEFN